MIPEVANHLISSGGKRLRPMLTLAAAGLCGYAGNGHIKLAASVATAFKGETLRGLLLNAYAFSKMGQIALIAAVVSFIGAGVMLLLSLLGFAHLRRVDPDVEVLTGSGHNKHEAVKV